ncbi:hypothetical protein B484DRAFT_423485 [Ochromonadaceae sp. CCMP2298]|nr:hypothetical protein B484DRAFT_423485 [Ochromonadaceae sp. CCMP2298]
MSDLMDRSNILNINVGVLGHVDSGKTSLVKSLSTSLSTAALDKNPQSQQRGITLDLGFSAFTLPMPEHLRGDAGAGYEFLQFTLVDCPGHASLIRTIIGGAQIIDMILLVVDANKGIQTQTAECIVIGEITTDFLIIVLNKIDTIPEDERAAKVERVTKNIRKKFASTKFEGMHIVPVAAAVGGEKVAAVGTGVVSQSKSGQKAGGEGAGAGTVSSVASDGIDGLLSLIQSQVRIPQRNYAAPFYFSIDHCFSVRGHGTVLTGTVLAGQVSVGSVLEMPHLQLQRKIKSLQMFRKPVKSARQGDRVGICVTNLDASAIERGVAAAPKSVPLLQAALCLVKKVRFFKRNLRSGSKVHVSIGHSTVVATVTFFGAAELAQLQEQGQEGGVGADAVTGVEGVAVARVAGVALTEEAEALPQAAALNACFHRGFPSAPFRYTGAALGAGARSSAPTAPTTTSTTQLPEHMGYEWQEEVLGAEGEVYGSEPVQWALLQFQQGVHCPLDSLVIGSRLDADAKEKESPCRLAFYGPLKASLSEEGGAGAVSEAALASTGVFSWRMKECEVFLLTDNTGPGGLCLEAVVWKLVTGGGAVAPFLGLQLECGRCGTLGTIVSSFGADGKCRVKFASPVRLRVGDRLGFRYKKYLFDKRRALDQGGLLQLRATRPLPLLSDANKEEVEVVEEVEEEKVEEVRGAGAGEGRGGKRRARRQRPAREQGPDQGAEQGDGADATANPIPALAGSVASPPPPQPPSSLSLSALEIGAETGAGDGTEDADLQGYSLREGVVESVKEEGGACQAIVKGAFSMAENVRVLAGAPALLLGGAGVRGELLGPFGKMGKVKVRFPGLGGGAAVGSTVRLYLPADLS